eukprot:TRINITY_DN5107_c0_g1_i1.p1 TRINITY_DN5107_c0_g1~~TRINITY_DN5107_c0_g1_i1.p1  ORF type:complete len:260 (-),score=24.13 TRINITY_DN5107_c0_g1_i1:381-1160(-)
MAGFRIGVDECLTEGHSMHSPLKPDGSSLVDRHVTFKLIAPPERSSSADAISMSGMIDEARMTSSLSSSRKSLPNSELSSLISGKENLVVFSPLCSETASAGSPTFPTSSSSSSSMSSFSDSSVCSHGQPDYRKITYSGSTSAADGSGSPSTNQRFVSLDDSSKGRWPHAKLANRRRSMSTNSCPFPRQSGSPFADRHTLDDEGDGEYLTEEDMAEQVKDALQHTAHSETFWVMKRTNVLGSSHGSPPARGGFIRSQSL